MTDNLEPSINIDPFINFPQVEVTVEEIVGYILEVDGMYEFLNGREVKNASTKETYNGLDAFIAILGGESGYIQYVKSNGNEPSYGIAQINTSENAHQIPAAKRVVAMNPNKGYSSITFTKSITEMSESEYIDFLKAVNDIQWQMEFAYSLMLEREKQGLDIFRDWRAWMPRDNKGDIIFQRDPSFLEHLEKSKIEIDQAQNNPDWMNVSRSKSQDHYTNNNPFTSENFGNLFTPENLSSYENQGSLDTETGQRDIDVEIPEEFGPEDLPAESGSFGATSNHAQWKTVKKYYVGDFYDQETDTFLEGYKDSDGYEDWYRYYGHIEFDSSGNRRESFNLEFPLSSEYTNSAGKKIGLDTYERDNFKDDFSDAYGTPGFVNPYDIRNMTAGDITYADSLASEVYNMFHLSAKAAGMSNPDMAAAEFMLRPGARDEVYQVINMILTQANTQEGGEYTAVEIIDAVLAHMTSYKRDGIWHEWQYEMPDFKAERSKGIQTEIEQIDNFVRPILLGYYPKLIDDIRVGWKNHRIVNPNTPATFEDYAMAEIRNHPKYATIYGRKPNAFSEAQYLSMFTQPLMKAGVATGSAYDSALTTSAALGADPSSTGTIGTFATGPKTTMGDTFTKKVSNMTDAIGTMLGGDE